MALLASPDVGIRRCALLKNRSARRGRGRITVTAAPAKTTAIPNMSLDTQTKLAIYRHFAETGQRPSLQVVAERIRADASSVREAYVRLRAQRVLVLEPDGVSIRMAPPFSGVPTQHVVIVDETKYFANCAWDSFGIPAALHRPGRLNSRCEQSGQALNLEIGLEGPPPCSWLFHCLVPAAKWWDDIVFT
jgi:Alkylmercury lyase